PLPQVEPVRRAQRLGDARVGVLGVEDVGVEVAADRDVVEADSLDVDERIGGQLRLAQREVLELQFGCELHQSRPVRASAGAHRRPIGSEDPISSIDQRPASSTAPLSPPGGKTKKLAASSSEWSNRSPSAPTSAARRRNRPSASGSCSTSKRSVHSPARPDQPSSAVDCVRPASTMPPSSRSSSETSGAATLSS